MTLSVSSKHPLSSVESAMSITSVQHNVRISSTTIVTLLFFMAVASTAAAQRKSMMQEEGMMSPEEINDMCTRSWQSWSPAIVPKGMSPVNALQALAIHKSFLRSLILRHEIVDDYPRVFDSFSRSPKVTKIVEKAFETLTRCLTCAPEKCIGEIRCLGGTGFTYIDYYNGNLIKTDFTSFPVLNADGFDREYGKGEAQRALDLYALVDEQLDAGNKTLARMGKWVAPAMMNRLCLKYHRLPNFIKPYFKPPENASLRKQKRLMQPPSHAMQSACRSITNASSVRQNICK